MQESKKYLTLQTFTLPFIAMAAVTAFFYFTAPIAVPVFIAISLAFILSPLVSFLRKLKIPHLIAVILVLVLALIVLSLIGYLLFVQINQFAADLPHYWESTLKLLEDLKVKFSTHKILSKFTQFDLTKLELKNFSDVPKYFVKGLSGLASFLFSSFLIFFLTFFILYDQKIIHSQLVKAFGKSEENVAHKIIAEINYRIKGFIVVKFVTTLFLAIIFTLGLRIMGVNYAYIWGPLAAITNLIPFVGAIIGLLPPLIVAIIQFNSFLIPLLVFIFFTAVQTLEGNLISPKLLEDKVNLSPLAILVSSMFWGWLWGAIGIILAVPITASLKVICDHIEPLQPIGIILSGRK